MHADCLYIWTTFESIMTSGSSRYPVVDRIISENFNSRTREDIVKSSEIEKIISPFDNVLRIVT